jgi:hypothetical protein
MLGLECISVRYAIIYTSFTFVSLSSKLVHTTVMFMGIISRQVPMGIALHPGPSARFNPTLHRLLPYKLYFVGVTCCQVEHSEKL